MSESNVLMSDDSVEDMRSALTILEEIRFQVGPELLRKDVTKAIQYLKHGLSTMEGESCPNVLFSPKGEKELGQDSMPQKYLIRFIGTEDYYSVFAEQPKNTLLGFPKRMLRASLIGVLQETERLT